MFMPMIWSGNSDDFFDDFNKSWDELDRAANRFFGNGELMPAENRAMKTDVIEEDKDYKLKADLPGFKKEDLHVEMNDGVLTISAEHEDKKDEKNAEGKYIRRERRTSSYRRSFRVDKNLKPEDISAKYEDGVLTLTIPKKEALPEKKETKMIDIQ